MRIQSILTIAAALALSLPLSAAQHRGRENFDSHRGTSVTVQIATPFGVGFVSRGPDRYGSDYYQDSRRFKRSKKFYKKQRKLRLKDHRQFRFQRHHVHGPECWY